MHIIMYVYIYIECIFHQMFQTHYMFHQLEKICILYHVIYWLVALTHHQQVCSSPQPDHLRGSTVISRKHPHEIN